MAAPIVIIAFPVPDIAGGWCGSGTTADVHGRYAIAQVSRTAFIADLLAAPCVVLGACALTERIQWRIATAIAVSSAVGLLLLITAFIYAGKVDCAFS